MQNFQIVLKIAFSKNSIIKSIKLALVVGTILNLINQGTELIQLDWSSLNIPKFFLTYLVPFSVSTYVGTRTKLEFQIGTESAADVSLKCNTCGEATCEVKKGEIVPVCDHCLEKTDWVLNTTEH